MLFLTSARILFEVDIDKFERQFSEWYLHWDDTVTATAVQISEGSLVFSARNENIVDSAPEEREYSVVQTKQQIKQKLKYFKFKIKEK